MWIRKLLLSLLCVLLFSCSLVYCIQTSDLINNLTISLNQLTVAKNQLTGLELELDNKTKLLATLQESNNSSKLLMTSLQESNNSLTLLVTNLQTSLSEQATSLTSLKTLNQSLMDTQEQLKEQLTTSQEQLTSLSKESKKKVSVNSSIWFIIGSALGVGITYLILK